jgi:antitoxin VapB
MPLNIKNDEAHRLAHRLSELSGSSLTDVVTKALREALERVEGERARRVGELRSELDQIATACAALPVLDSRSSDQILGYDEDGVPR